MNNKEQRYGQNKLAYGVIEKQDGRIELRVYHQNRAVRKMISNHSDHPRYFFDNLQSFSGSKTRAKFWLAHLIVDYADYFRNGHVDIIFVS